MATPGSNLLKQAFKAIARQTVSYYAFVGRVTNSIGIDQDVYNPPEDIRGSLQPIPQNRYAELGLDFNKT